jgi:redox-sensitive bicupin YhaK (pirin superfamily)
MLQHWAEEIPKHTFPDGKVTLTVWAGELEGMRGLPPAPNSYGCDPNSELGIWFIEIRPGGKYTLPPAKSGNEINRRLYFVEGDGLTIGGEAMRQRTEITVHASQNVELANQHESQVVEVLVLQGRPLGEPVAQQGPFVMNSKEEIQQAFADYRRTQFGGWPWPQDAMVFPREKSRFSLSNGKEVYPPSAKAAPSS